MLQTFEYCDREGDIRGIAIGHSKRTEIEEDGTTSVFILDEFERISAVFFLLPGEMVQVREVPADVTDLVI